MIQGLTLRDIAKKHKVSGALVNYAIRGKRNGPKSKAIIQTLKEMGL